MAVTVATIIAQAKLIADRADDTSIPDAAGWLVWANRAVESVWRMLTSIDPAAYFSQYDITLTGTLSGAQYDLGNVLVSPAFRGLHGVDLDATTSNRRTIGRVNFQNRNQGAIGWWAPALLAPDRQYELRGRTLVIDPWERAAGSYRVYYRGAPYQFTGVADATSIDWQLEPYVEAVEILMARKALGQEDSDTSFGSERLAEIRQEMIDAQERDDNAAAVIADVEDLERVGYR